MFVVFFFQAEDGIRDLTVTGVQTCALPIWLAHDKARPNGDGAGDHARGSATFLTGCQARKTHGADIRVGVSVDQAAAAKIGKATRLPSIELGCDRGQQAGNCDSGYSCAYSFNISWKTESTPLPAEVNPRLAFDRLFASGRKD